MESATPYNSKAVSELHPYRIDGMVTRTSLRWFRHWPSERRNRSVPYITETGKFSACELATWNCYPEQLLASNTSTIYTRLLKMWMKRKQRFRNIGSRDKKLLLQVAAFYATSHSDYFMDRALACLHKPGPLSRMLTYFVRRLDDKYWFVYRQICYQIHWLTFQSLGISDKSSKKLLKSFMSSDIKEFRNDVIKGSFETASNDCSWIEFRKTKYVPVPKLRDRIKDPIVLAFFEDWSEPELDSD
jgi:hypothetical protein